MESGPASTWNSLRAAHSLEDSRRSPSASFYLVAQSSLVRSRHSLDLRWPAVKATEDRSYTARRISSRRLQRPSITNVQTRVQPDPLHEKTFPFQPFHVLP